MKGIFLFAAVLSGFSYALPTAQDIGTAPDFGPGRLARSGQDIETPPDFGPGRTRRQDIGAAPDFGPGRARRQNENDSVEYDDPAGGLPPIDFPRGAAQEIGVPSDFGPGRARRQDDNESTEVGEPAGVIPPYDPARRSAQEIGTPPNFGPGRARRQDVGLPPDFGPGKIATASTSIPGPLSAATLHPHPKNSGNIEGLWKPLTADIPAKKDEDYDEDKPKSFEGHPHGPPHGKPSAFADVKPWGHSAPKAQQFMKTKPSWNGAFGTDRPIKPYDPWFTGTAPLVPNPRVTGPTSIAPHEFTGPAVKKHVETETSTTRTWRETVPYTRPTAEPHVLSEKPTSSPTFTGVSRFFNVVQSIANIFLACSNPNHAVHAGDHDQNFIFD
jgi:hypothetical protein